MYAGSKYESHYTVWTARISIRVRVRVYFILKNLAAPGTTVHVPTARFRGVLHKPRIGIVLDPFLVKAIWLRETIAQAHGPNIPARAFQST